MGMLAALAEAIRRQGLEATAGPYVTKLSAPEEMEFQQWVQDFRIPWADEPYADYDMRGFWKAMKEGDPLTVRRIGTEGAPPVFSLSGPVKGMRERGNIDIGHRPLAWNPELKEFSSVLSESFGIDKDEVLVPRVTDEGKILTPDQALDEYRRTGRHLGKFSNRDSAKAYSLALHNQQAALPVGHFSDKWKTPYHKYFSSESIYALPGAPHWVGNERLVK